MNRRRPEEKLIVVRSSVEATKLIAEQRRSGINKTAITLKADKDVLGDSAGVAHPTDEQLERINQFTRSPKTAEEVVVFNTMSCNDMWDRDDDRFKTQCVKDFAKLSGPFSSVGKAYMVSHDYSKLPVGRVFGAGTKSFEVDSQKFTSLTNEVFMPNTDQYKSFIENVDFGIYWAVSVGVVLGASSCSIGKEHGWGPWPWWCSEGHEKGFYYDPDSDEEDSWGWPMPVEATAKNAQKCGRELFEPQDFYELSQCFLGAQYMAELEKDPAFDGVVKTASAAHIPVIGLKSEEAAPLPFSHAPDRIRQAMRFSKTMEYTDSGSMIWVEDGLVYEFTPDGDEGEVLCLGESIDGNKAPHGNFDGSHTHEHSTYGAQGDDQTHEHLHSHANDAMHDHSHGDGKAVGDASPCAKGATGQGVSESSWDGSASRFSDDEYKMSSAICRGESDSPKTDCSLPHHEPEGKVSRAGVHSAAGRVNSTKNLSDDQRSKAKSHLSSHYTKDLDEEVPDSLKMSRGDWLRAQIEAIAEKADGLKPKIAAYKAPEDPGDDEDEDPVDLAQALDATLDAMRDAADEEEWDQVCDLLTAAEQTVDELVELLGGTDPDDTDTGKTAEGEEMSKKAVLAAVKAAGLPTSFYEKLAEVEGDDSGLELVLRHAAEEITVLSAEVETLAPKAAWGDAWVKSLESDARKAFVRANQNGDGKVDTKFIDRLIKMSAGDPELLKDLRDQYEEMHRQKHPEKRVTSAFPDDPNEDKSINDGGDEPAKPVAQTVHSRVR